MLVGCGVRLSRRPCSFNLRGSQRRKGYFSCIHPKASQTVRPDRTAGKRARVQDRCIRGIRMSFHVDNTTCTVVSTILRGEMLPLLALRLGGESRDSLGLFRRGLSTSGRCIIRFHVPVGEHTSKAIWRKPSEPKDSPGRVSPIVLASISVSESS